MGRTSAPRSVWGQVKDLVDEGMGAVIEVHPGQRRKPSRARRPGRQRVFRQLHPYEHYADFDPMKMIWPRCQVCRRVLRKAQVSVCTDECLHILHERLATLQEAVTRAAV